MHRPVLLAEVVRLLPRREGGTYVDGTVGDGGHAEAVLEAIGPRGRLVAIDRDEDALERARRRLAKWGEQCVFVHGSFAEMAAILRAKGLGPADGILLDLGVSSEQLEKAERGFSVSMDGPLDMRMDRSAGMPAAHLVNSMSERDLIRVLREYGEERAARPLARAIVRERERSPILTTARLARIVSDVKGGVRGRIHPATQTFQALRIMVNDELKALETALPVSLDAMAPGGRLAVISFHSLEDRIVKNFFREHAGRWESLPSGGRAWVSRKPEVRILTRKPIVPGEPEVRENPRSRSAKLRVAEKKE